VIGLHLVGGRATLYDWLENTFGGKGEVSAESFNLNYIRMLTIVMNLTSSIHALNLGGIIHGDMHLGNCISTIGSSFDQHLIDFSRAIVPISPIIFPHLPAEYRTETAQKVNREYFIVRLQLFYERYNIAGWDINKAARIVHEHYDLVISLFGGMDLYELLSKIDSVVSELAASGNLAVEPNKKYLSDWKKLALESLNLNTISANLAAKPVPTILAEMRNWFSSLPESKRPENLVRTINPADIESAVTKGMELFKSNVITQILSDSEE
jgi:hypothetical protein